MPACTGPRTETRSPSTLGFGYEGARRPHVWAWRALALLAVAAAPSPTRAQDAGPAVRVVFHGTSESRSPGLGDWAPGYWKGSCAANEAVSGLSVFVSNGQARAVVCKPPSSISLQGGATLTTHTRGKRNPSGAVGNLFECAEGEVVAGIAQSTAGSIHGLRCAATNGKTSDACEVRKVYGGRGYSGAHGDWDPGFHKADCPVGKAVVGAFVDHGNVHSIVCCATSAAAPAALIVESRNAPPPKLVIMESRDAPPPRLVIVESRNAPPPKLMMLPTATQPAPPAALPPSARAPGAVIFHGTSASRDSSADWASGNWKATCAAGEAIGGISTFTGGNGEPHAALCKPTTLAASAQGTKTDSKRGTRPNRPLGTLIECADNEIVSGLSQHTGAPFGLNAVRCTSATGAVTEACEARTLAGGGGYTGAFGDWDSSYYKAECTAGKFAVGAFIAAGKVSGLYCCGAAASIAAGTKPRTTTVATTAPAEPTPAGAAKTFRLRPFNVTCSATPAGEETWTVRCGSATWKMTGKFEGETFELEMPLGPTVDPAVALADALGASSSTAAATALTLPRTLLANSMRFKDAKLSLTNTNGVAVTGNLTLPTDLIGSNLAPARLLVAAVKGVLHLTGAGSATVPATVSLAAGNSELDLSVGLTLVEMKRTVVSPPLSGAGARAAFRGLELVFHGKQGLLGGTPSFSFEVAGSFYLQPTRWDHWQKVALTLEGAIGADGPRGTIGGALLGACGADVPAIDAPCAGKFDLFNAGLVTAQGGTLKVTFDATGTPVEIEGIAENANAPNFPARNVWAAIKVELGSSPSAGAGFYFRADRVSWLEFLRFLPLPSNGVLNTLQDAYLAAQGFEDVELYASPTGMATGAFKPLKAPNRDPVDLARPGVVVRGRRGPFAVDALVQGDVHQLFVGNRSAALTGSVKLSADITEVVREVEKRLRSIPAVGPILAEVLNTFSLYSASAMLQIKGGIVGGTASVNMKVLGKNVTLTLPPEVLAAPATLADYLVERIKGIAGDTGKLVLYGLEKAAVTVAEGVQQAGNEIARAAGIVGDGVVTAANVVASGVANAGRAIASLFSPGRSKSILQALWEIANNLGAASILDLDYYKTRHAIEIADRKWTAGRMMPIGSLPTPSDSVRGDERALLHWIWVGSQTVGYDASPWFSAWNYLEFNRDVEAELIKAKGGGDRATLLQAAGLHFANQGLAEGRVASNTLSFPYYLFKNRDLIGSVYAQRGYPGLLGHYRAFGVREKRPLFPQVPTGLVGVAPGISGNAPCRALRAGTMVGGYTYALGTDAKYCLAGSADGARTDRLPVYEVLKAAQYEWAAAGQAPQPTWSRVVVGFNKGTPSYVCGIPRSYQPSVVVPGSTLRGADGRDVCVAHNMGDAAQPRRATNFRYLAVPASQWIEP